MRKILLPTDFSDNAWNAIVYGLSMFKDEECGFYILHTHFPRFYEADYLGIMEDTLSGLQLTKGRIQRDFPNKKHRFHQHSAFDLLTDEIRDLVKEKNIDIIVMGTRGATGALRVLFGSNTVFVIRKVSIPVLAIPGGYTYKGIKRVLFPVNHRKSCKEEDLKPLMDIVKKNRAVLTVIYVREGLEWTPAEQQNKDVLEGFLAGIDVEFIMVEETDITRAINKYMAETQYDLLAMIYRKYSLLERLLTRQNVENIGFSPEIPFLVLRSTVNE